MLLPRQEYRSTATGAAWALGRSTGVRKARSTVREYGRLYSSSPATCALLVVHLRAVACTGVRFCDIIVRASAGSGTAAVPLRNSSQSHRRRRRSHARVHLRVRVCRVLKIVPYLGGPRVPCVGLPSTTRRTGRAARTLAGMAHVRRLSTYPRAGDGPVIIYSRLRHALGREVECFGY